jgi:ribosomal protein S18 acetylase RimI-like enzyme
MRRLSVLPRYRRERVATQLMSAAGLDTLNCGLHLVLDVADSNRDAVAF